LLSSLSRRTYLLPCLESRATWFLSINDDSGTELIDETRRGLLPINAAGRNADARMGSSRLFTVEHLRRAGRSRLPRFDLGTSNTLN
jgi:hypothetical protein